MIFLDNLLKFLRVLLVIAIPIAALQYFFNFDWKEIGTKVLSWVDTNVLIAIAPWIGIMVLLCIIINILDKLKKQKEAQILDVRTKEIHKEQTVKASEEEKKGLVAKQAVYLAVQLVFSKFTMTGFSDEEVDAQKENIKTDILSQLYLYHGKRVESEEFENEDVFVFLFYSQEDAIEYLSIIKQKIPFLDDELQTFGYSLGFKAVFDVRVVGAMQSYVIEFLTKVLNSFEIAEICTTIDFANRYKIVGKNAKYIFTSKGNYSINKSRVELMDLSLPDLF